MSIYHYIVIFRKDFIYNQLIINSLGWYLLKKIKQIPNTAVKVLVIEDENRSGQPHMHILINTTIEEHLLIKELDHIKVGVPSVLKRKKLIPDATPIFSKYKGTRTCPFYTDKSQCPGKSNCKLAHLQRSLPCENYNALDKITDTAHLTNIKNYFSKKKNNNNTLYFYED